MLVLLNLVVYTVRNEASGAVFVRAAVAFSMPFFICHELECRWTLGLIFK